jgi:hypothetical protein
MFSQRSRINDLEDLRAVPKAEFFEHYMRMSLNNEAIPGF